MQNANTATVSPLVEGQKIPANDQIDPNPEFEKGKAYFNAIAEYAYFQLHEGVKGATRQQYTQHKKKIDDRDVKACLSITNTEGKTVFIRFDFLAAGSWGNKPEYRIGIYTEEKATQAIKGEDSQMLLMNSQRGENGFEERFTQFMRMFTNNRDLPKFTLS